MADIVLVDKIDMWRGVVTEQEIKQQASRTLHSKAATGTGNTGKPVTGTPSKANGK